VSFLLCVVDHVKGDCELSIVAAIEGICELFNVMANASMLVMYFY
jgi:hypothetical protein